MYIPIGALVGVIVGALVGGIVAGLIYRRKITTVSSDVPSDEDEFHGEGIA